MTPRFERGETKRGMDACLYPSTHGTVSRAKAAADVASRVRACAGRCEVSVAQREVHAGAGGGVAITAGVCTLAGGGAGARPRWVQQALIGRPRRPHVRWQCGIVPSTPSAPLRNEIRSYPESQAAPGGAEGPHAWWQRAAPAKGPEAPRFRGHLTTGGSACTCAATHQRTDACWCH
jgi:hypothetical protein